MTTAPHAVRDLVDADRELALLRELIQAASSGPGRRAARRGGGTDDHRRHRHRRVLRARARRQPSAR